MPAPTFFFHDYETFGADPRRDRPAQFAGLRTNWDLEPIGEPIVAWCKPPRDTLPRPEACLVTGITPQRAERDGLIEAEFARVVHDALVESGTCAVGYNSLRFDDEVTRHLLYRNFFDPYAREWQNDNSRWDLIDLARMAYALRPDGIAWPHNEEGRPSFRLDDLATANGLDHAHAHDALSDVEATLALARILRARQPRLFEFYLGLRSKRRALELLDWLRMTPVLHVSSRYRAERGCIAIVAPICELPGQPNAVVVYDLDSDPSPLAMLEIEAIRDRVYTARRDLPEDVERLPLKVVHANRCPALAPLSVLAGTNLARIGLDVARAEAHLERLRGFDGVADRVRQAMAREEAGRAAEDVDVALYSGGFMCEPDRALSREVRATPPEALAAHAAAFREVRCRELLFRYRARNWPQTLDAGEAERWRQLRRERLLSDRDEGLMSYDAFRARIAALRAETRDTGQHLLLDAVEAWGHELVAAVV